MEHYVNPALIYSTLSDTHDDDFVFSPVVRMKVESAQLGALTTLVHVAPQL